MPRTAKRLGRVAATAERMAKRDRESSEVARLEQVVARRAAKLDEAKRKLKAARLRTT